MVLKRILKNGFILSLLIFLFGGESKAQMTGPSINSLYIGELGFGLGGGHYFGDLNNKYGLKAPKLSGGAYFRYFFNDYFSASLHADFAKLGYSDAYNKNVYEHTRNLSFNTSIFSFSLRGAFNFFKYVPGSDDHRFTPYVGLGVGLFHFNPYALYQGEKYFLQPIGTEGQASSDYPDKKPYGLWAFEVPFEVGVKYNLNRQWGLFLSATYFFTGTDYLDDVSGTYAGPDAFVASGTKNQEAAFHLQDRSYVYGDPIGAAGVRRGDHRGKDQFVLLHVGVTFLLSDYRCPF